MAIGVEQLKSNDVQYQSNSIGSVIDVSFLQSLKLKTGKDQPAFEKAINDWAEKQIDDDLEIDQLKAHLQSGQSVDKYFDRELIGDFYSSKDELKNILEQYIDSINEYQHETRALASAINFQLTAEGQHKVNNVMNVDQVANHINANPQQYQKDENGNYYTVGVDGKKIPVSIPGGSHAPTYASGTSAKAIWNEIPYGGTNTPKESPQSLLNKIEKSQETPDDLTKYNQQNLYKRNTENVSDSSTWSERKVLRNWIRGSRDGFLDIIETKGDAKFTRPDAAEKNKLREYFKRPLRDLVINKDINLENIRNEMQSVLNTKGTVLQGLGSESSNADYRKNNIPPEWKVAEKDKKEVSEALGKLSALYVSWRRDRTFAGSYTDRLMGMVNNFNNGDKLYNFADGEDITLDGVKNEFKNVTDANNDNVGETKLRGDHVLLDKQSKDNRALRELSSLVGGGKTPDFFDDKSINSLSMQSVLNVSLTGKFSREDTTLRTILKQNPDLLSVIEKAKSSTSETYSPNFDVMLAEAKAYGASAVDVYNIKALAEFGDVDEARRGKVSDGLRFANFLADYDHNGNAGGPADHGINSGGQILRDFTSAAWEIANTMPYTMDGKPDETKAQDMVSKSILAYAIKTADNTNNYYASQVLKKYFSGGKSVLDLPKEHPGLLKYVQSLLKDNQTDLRSIMFASVAPEGNVGSLESYRTEEYMTLAQDVSGKSLDDILKNVPEADKAKVIASIKQQAKTLFDSQYTSALSSLSSEEQAYFKGYVSLSLLENQIANLVAQDLTVNQQGAGLGLGVGLVKHVQLNLGVAMGPDGKPLPGVGLGFSNEAKTLGANANWTLFGPNVGAYATLGKWDNRDKLANTLSIQAKRTNSIGLHAGYSNLTAGAGLSHHQSIDHLGGIDHTANIIRSEANQFVDQLLNNANLAGHVAAIDRITRERGGLPTDSELTSHTIGLRNIIRSILTKKYPDQSSEEYEVAVENIVGGIMQNQYQGQRRERDNIVNYFVEQRKGAAISDLKGKTKVTGWGIGLHAFVNPKNLIAGGPLGAISAILPFSIQISKYDSGFTHLDTQDSQYQARRSQYLGLGNREMPMTLDQRVNYLNGAITRSRGMIDLQTQKTFPKITTDGKFYYIPKLYYQDNVLNVKISPDMAGKIAHEGNNLVVPVSTDLRFFSKFESQHAVNVLNIGSSSTSGSDIHLLRFKDDKLGTQIDGKPLFVNKNTIDVASTVVGVEGVNTEELKLKLIAWGVNISTIRVENNILIYTTTNNSVEQKVSLNGGKIGDITLSTTNEGLTISKITASGSQKEEFTVAYDIQGNTKSLIDGLSKINPATLEKFETTHPTQLRSFLSALIDNDDSAALSALRLLNIPELQSAIKNSDNTLSNGEISAYMAQAFALEPDYKNKTALDLMDARDGSPKKGSQPAFERIDGPNSTISSFLNRDMLRSAYANTNAKVGQPSSGDRAEDVLGYTAFYRGRKSGEHRGYAMTVPGYTNILGGKENYKTFDDANKSEKAKEWLFNKIENDTFARESIIKGLQKSILPEYRQYVASLNTVDLIKVLNGGTVSLGGKCDLQVSATPIFYLLAECANESIGLKINVVTCTGEGGKSISEKIAGKPILKYNLGNMYTNISHTKGSAVGGKSTVVNLAGAVGTTFDGGNKSGGPKEGKVKTNPGGGPKDDSGPGTGPGGAEEDSDNNNTEGG